MAANPPSRAIGVAAAEAEQFLHEAAAGEAAWRARPHTVLGWDAETTLGYVKLLACSNKTAIDCKDLVPHHIEWGVRDLHQIDPKTHKPKRVMHEADLAYVETVALLDFLFAGGMDADFNVFWNVKFDFSAIIKPYVVQNKVQLKANHLKTQKLAREIRQLNALADTDGLNDDERRRRTTLEHEAEELESVEKFEIGIYRITYIPKKGFRITRMRAHRKHGKNSVTFYDAMTWYSSTMSDTAGLDTMAKKYLGYHKTAEEEGIHVDVLGSTPGYYEEHREQILRYCINDCVLTAQLFEKTIAGFDNLNRTAAATNSPQIPFPEQPWSRASAARSAFKEMSKLESTREAYEPMSESGYADFFKKAYRGACIHVQGVGTWTDVKKFDIGSAYPAAMTLFPSLAGCGIVAMADEDFARCFFKFYRIKLTPTPRMAVHSEDNETGDLCYLDGGAPRIVYVTQYDLDIFDEWNDHYEILDGIGILTVSEERPLDELMTGLYRRKSEVKIEFGDGSIEYLNIKIPMNGGYGVLAQSRPREGHYTNFVYAAYITAWCRRELWHKTHEIQAQGGTVLSWMTDGLLVADLPNAGESSTKLGEWEIDDVGIATIFANGIYVIDGKLKKRGAPQLRTDDLLAAERPWVGLDGSGPLTLKPGIIRGIPEDIGVWQPEHKDLVPWRMLENTGLRVPPHLKSAALKSFFTERWFLEHRVADEPVLRLNAAQALGLEAIAPRR